MSSRKVVKFTAAGLVIGAAVVGAASLSQNAKAGSLTGCKLMEFQGRGQAEAQLGQLFAEGATIVNFWKEPTQMPYQAFVCAR